MNERDDGLRAPPHADVGLGQVALEAHPAAERSGVFSGALVLDVEPRTERTAFAPEDDDSRVVVLV